MPHRQSTSIAGVSRRGIAGGSRAGGAPAWVTVDPVSQLLSPAMSTPLDQLTFDRLAPFPALAKVRAAAASADWSGVAACYGELDSWDMRTAAVRAVGETPGAEHF